MREIKFRYVVKSKVTGKIHKVIYFLRQIEQVPLHKLSDVFGDGYELISVDPFTGIKDDDGNDIFVGDIAKDYDGKIYEVIWDDFCFNLKDFYNSFHDYPSLAFSENIHVKVIGNVHENRELVGGESE